MITASKVGRLLRCPGSAALHQIRSHSDAAERGTAIHRFLEVAMRDGVEAALVDVPEEYRELCESIDLERLPSGLEPELAIVYDAATDTARRIGSGIGREYGELGPFEVAMTLDVAGVSDDAVFALDYKAWRRNPGPAAVLDQLRVCALGLARLYGKERAVTAIAHVRPDGSVWTSYHEMDCLDLDATALDLRRLHGDVAEQKGRAARREPLELAEGPWCTFCEGFAACPAKARLAVQLADPQAMSVESMGPLTPERAGIAWDRVKTARALLNRIETACIATLDENGGTLPLPGGRELRRVTKPGNERLDGETVHRIVAELHGREVADAAVEMAATKSGLKNALRPLDTKRGALTRAVDEVLDKVRQAGGVERKPSVSVEEVEAA